MSFELPAVLRKLLLDQYGEDVAARIFDGLYAHRPATLRVNALRSTREAVTSALSDAGISFYEVPWYSDALIIDGAREPQIRELDIYQSGSVYLQSLSSMIPPLVLDPRAGESILDMAAAPGGKTTQMAALTMGAATITACEKNKVRAERLKYNLSRQGAGGVSVLVTDSRRLDDMFSFDKILLDAPCSGSGTVSPEKCEFTEDLYQRSQRFQEELLKKALRLLKSGHRMVYSTCSILAGENEDILKKVLPRAGAHVVPIPDDAFGGAPRLPVKIEGTLCICPSELYEGFFVALIEKN